MDKRRITMWWIGGLIGIAVGAILISSSIGALRAHLEPVTQVNPNRFFADGYSWTMLTLIALGIVLASAGVIAQFVAWMGAVLNTYRLADRRWFNAVLWGGIVGIVTTPLFGIGAAISGSLTIAYLVGGPYAIDSRPPMNVQKETIKKWTNWGIAAMAGGTIFSLLVPRATYPGGLLHGLVWPSLVLVSLGATVVVAGVIALTVAWWGAMFNTRRLADRTWFELLLWSGVVAAVTGPLFGIGALIGLGVMIAYLRAGPDGMVVQQAQSTAPTALARAR